MSDVGNIVYGPGYGTGMGKPPKVTVTPTPETHYVVTECPDCAALRSRIATLEAQVKQARAALGAIQVNAIVAYPKGIAFDHAHKALETIYATADAALQALREGGEG